MSQNKLEKSSIDYQPDAVALSNQPLPWWAKHGLVWMGLFFLAVLIWSCVAQVDVIVEGIGKIVPITPAITMKPLELTVIKSINVNVGDRVNAGQSLISFDPTIARADEGRLLKDLSTYKAQYNRLKCEFEGRSYAPDAADIGNPDVEKQVAMFRQRTAYYKERMSYFDSSVKRVDASMHSTRENLGKLEKQLEHLRQIVKMYEILRDKNATSVREFLQAQISLIQMEADVEKNRNYIHEQEQEKQATIASKNSFVQEWNQDVSSQLIKAEKDMNDTGKVLEKVKMQVSYVDLKSPVKAMVHEIASFSVGSAVREAEPLITLVPLDCEMLLEAEIPTRDIGKIKIGDPVRIKLTAFPYQKHGTLDGTILTISEDSTTNRQAQLNEDIGKVNARAFYRARIRVFGKLHNLSTDFRLIPGMEAQAEIKVGKRRIVEYVLYPLMKSLQETAREP